MSDAIDQQGCFRHRASTRYFTIYEDFQDIAKGKHADKIAAFLRILEVKTNKKIIAYQVQAEEAKQNGQPLPKLNLWLEVSYSDFVSWSLHLFGRSSFQVADKEAEKMLFCKSRIRNRHSQPSDPKSPLVEYKEYLIITENVQAALDERELPITGEEFEAYDTPTKFNMPPIKNNTGTPIKNNTGYIENNRYKSKSKESTTKESISSSTALRANNDASPVAEKVKETKMPFTEEEQVFWSLLCEARTLQEKRLYRELERWSKPTKLQREQITAILQKLQENGFSVRSLTPEMIEQAWIDEMEVRSYLKRDPEWKVGNLESALLTYLKQYAHVATEKPVATPVSPEDLSSTVLWTKTPHLLLGSLEQYWPILEWMPAGEARKHRYGEYEPLSAEEIEQYEQLAGQQEPKRLRLV